MNRNLRKVAAVLAIAVFSVVLTVPALSQKPVQIDDVWYVFDSTNLTATVTSDFQWDEWDHQISYYGDVVIPPYVEYKGKNYEVTSIAPYTFDYTFASSLSIPETVVEADQNSFGYMISLNTVTVDEANPVFKSFEGVLYSRDMKAMLLFPSLWENSPYYNPDKPGEFTIPEGVEEIDTFFSRSFLERVVFPNTIKKICSNAFWCSDITSIELPESLEYIGEGCFSDLRNGFDLRIPDNVTYIGDYCFSESPFTSIALPKGITCIGEGWFQDCHDLKTITLHEGITKISRMAFNRCSVDLELPQSLVELDRRAFQGIDTQELRLPDRLKELPDSLFCNSPIRKVCLGNGIERIGSIFTGCPNIADIYCPMESAPEVDSENPLGLDSWYQMMGKVNVHVRSGCVQAYLDSPWKLVGPIIEDLTDGVNEVGDDMAIHDDELCEAYSLSGATVASRLRFGEVSNALPKGLYIIRTDSGKSEKIIVK